MSPTPLEAGQATLATELLDNRRSRDLIPQLNDFENVVFGPDFACTCAQFQPWVESGCLFYSAVRGEAVTGRSRILSVLSVFITTAISRDRMLRGEIADFELAPWTAGAHSVQPTIYLSSVVSAAPHHLADMYKSLLRDVQEFRDANGINFHGGFAIATGEAGFRHMAKNGFRLLDGYKYRGTYELMVIDAATAATALWQGLFSDETTFLRRAADASQFLPVSASVPLPPAVTEADAHEVEKRLALAKTERLRRSMDF